MSDTCTHLDEVEDVSPSDQGCHECLQLGGQWVHLRMCQTCGHIGCCDNSPGKHATAHFFGSDHALIRSLEPGEEWVWCFVDQSAMLIPQIHGQTRIPPSPLGG